MGFKLFGPGQEVVYYLTIQMATAFTFLAEEPQLCWVCSSCTFRSDGPVESTGRKEELCSNNGTKMLLEMRER